eukprot:jgi/Astpho2/8400/e_gw1.00122.116.1_t
MAPLLSASPDRFDGIIVDETKLPDDVDEFKTRLSNSIKVWQQQQKHGVWIKVPMKKAALISAAVEQGFEPHHAEPAYFMLTRWLPETESTLPPNASHQVGVGSFVVNGRNEVLVVQEKYGTLRGKGLWKLPTGLVLAGELRCAWSLRATKHACGCSPKFQAVLGVRQMHRMAFGKSDLFFICGLRTTSDDQELVAQPTEVEAVKWMPMDDYVNSPLAKSTPLYGRMVEQCRAWAHGEKLFPHCLPQSCTRRSSALLLTMSTSTNGAATLSLLLGALWYVLWVEKVTALRGA